MSVSQHGKIIRMLKRNKRKGVANYEFAGVRILDYTARISELRQDGHNIVAVRDFLPNGRATNVFRYFLVEKSEKKLRFWQQ